jgi:hypothetical protein
MESVAAGDEIALYVHALTVKSAPDDRPLAVEPLHARIAHFIMDFGARGQPCGDKVLDHLLLTVDPDRTATREVTQRNAMRLTFKPELDAVMRQPLAHETTTDTGLAQQIDGGLLEHARAHPPLDVLAASALDDDGFDALQVKQVRKHQPGGTGADDAYLGAHGITRWRKKFQECGA